MRSLLLCIFLSLGLPALAQEKFALPRKLDVLPATYLEELRVENPNRQLNKNQRRQLCQLFADSYFLSKRKYKQDYLINVQAPVYRLFKYNFPGIAAKEGEGGHVFMGDIFGSMKTVPECISVTATWHLAEKKKRQARPDSRQQSVPLFEDSLIELKRNCGIPIYLPVYLGNENEAAPLYATLSGVNQVHYQLVLGFSENCDGGNACRWGTVFGEKSTISQKIKGMKVRLVNDITGYYEKSVCGANCSDAKVTWFMKGNRYMVGIKAADLKKVVKMANSAIESGPR